MSGQEPPGCELLHMVSTAGPWVIWCPELEWSS